MAIEKLSAIRVAKLKTSGMYADGGGLYLQITSAAAKSWIFRYSVASRSREMGLGSLTAIPLADARELAAECRAQRAAGLDPIAERDAERKRQALEHSQADRNRNGIPFGKDM